MCEQIKSINEFNKTKLENIINELSNNRKVFHNEQDFQFELANIIKEDIGKKSNIVIRLEYFINEENGKKNYIDIILFDKISKEAVAIELKYKEAEVEFKYNDEWYCLKEHGARDWGCYDILRDLKRLEDIVLNKEKKYNLKEIEVIKGFVVFLTNDYDKYRNKNKKMDGIFHNYCLKEDENNKVNIYKKEYKFCKKGTNQEIDYEEIIDEYGSIKNKKPLIFERNHTGFWSNYSYIKKEEIQDGKKEDINVHCLIIEVENKGGIK